MGFKKVKWRCINPFVINCDDNGDHKVEYRTNIVRGVIIFQQLQSDGQPTTTDIDMGILERPRDRVY